MIEAVNSTIANAATMRSVVEQTDSASVPEVTAVLPSVEAGAPEVPQAPFVSPYISIDLDFDKAVLQIRDSETGDVQQQFPSESRLAQINRARLREERLQGEVIAGNSSSSYSSPEPVSSGVDIVTVQDVTSSQPSNTASTITPSVAVAALSAGAQSGSSQSTAGVTVYA